MVTYIYIFISFISNLSGSRFNEEKWNLNNVLLVVTANSLLIVATFLSKKKLFLLGSLLINREESAPIICYVVFSYLLKKNAYSRVVKVVFSCGKFCGKFCICFCFLTVFSVARKDWCRPWTFNFKFSATVSVPYLI